MRQRHYGAETSSEELSWTFNDFILGFLMIIMMMASVFALFSNAVVVDSFINQCDDPNDPKCGAGNTIFGGRQRGIADDKLVEMESAAAAEESNKAIRKWAGIGDLGGDSEIAFTVPSLSPQKENLVFRIQPDGTIFYRNEVKSVGDIRNLINTLAVEKGVFLEAIVDKDVSFETYKRVKNQLWDLTDAEHWRDVAYADENAQGIDDSVRQFGTTFTEASELDVLKEADRSSDSTDPVFEFDFNELVDEEEEASFIE